MSVLSAESKIKVEEYLVSSLNIDPELVNPPASYPRTLASPCLSIWLRRRL